MRETDIGTGPQDANPYNLQLSGDTLVFTANDSVFGSQLWSIEGANETLRRLSNFEFSNSSYPRDFTLVNETVFFTSTNPENGP